MHRNNFLETLSIPVEVFLSYKCHEKRTPITSCRADTCVLLWGWLAKESFAVAIIPPTWLTKLKTSNILICKASKLYHIIIAHSSKIYFESRSEEHMKKSHIKLQKSQNPNQHQLANLITNWSNNIQKIGVHEITIWWESILVGDEPVLLEYLS